MIEIHVYIEADDVDRGVAFYNAAVGLRVRRKLAERWIELEGAAVPIFIHAHRDVSRSFDRGGPALHEWALKHACGAQRLTRDAARREWALVHAYG